MTEEGEIKGGSDAYLLVVDEIVVSDREDVVAEAAEIRSGSGHGLTRQSQPCHGSTADIREPGSAAKRSLHRHGRPDGGSRFLEHT